MKVLVPTISSNAIGTIIVSILLISILTRIFLQWLKSRPSKEEKRKVLEERIVNWKKKLEFALASYKFTTLKEIQLRDSHQHLLAQKTAQLDLYGLEILISRITIAISSYPEPLHSLALAQGESKGNSETVKHKKEKANKRPTTRSSTQIAKPIPREQWK